jgi:hypothetical protein
MNPKAPSLPRPMANPALSRLRGAFEGSENIFCDSATIFGFSMMAASIREAYNGNPSHTDTTAAGSTATFSGLATVSPNVPTTLRRPRKWLQVLCLLINLILLSSVNIISTSGSPTEITGRTYANSSQPPPRRPYPILRGQLFWSSPFGYILQLCNGRKHLDLSVPVIHGSDSHQKPKVEHQHRTLKSPLQAFRGWPFLIVAPLYLPFTWVLLAFITTLRMAILSTAGPSDQEEERSLGQIIALCTWVPVLVEFTYILICMHSVRYSAVVSGLYWPHHAVGMEEGLQERLPLPGIPALRPTKDISEDSDKDERESDPSAQMREEVS